MLRQTFQGDPRAYQQASFRVQRVELMQLLHLCFALASSTALRHFPGVETLSKGYDVAAASASRLPIFAFSYEENNTQSITPFHPDDVYILPDRIIYDSGEEYVEIEYQQTSLSLHEYYSQQLTTETHHGWFHSKSTTTYDFAHHAMLRNESKILHYKYLELFSLEVNTLPPSNLHPTFAEAVQDLPTYDVNNSTSSEAYRNFFGNFGTDFIYLLKMGAHIGQQTWFHSCLVDTFGEHWVTKEERGSFFGLINWNSGHHSDVGKRNATWEISTDSLATLDGGDTIQFEPFKYGSLQKWMNTTHLSPAPIQFKTMHISSIVASLDPSKYEDVEKARADYMNSHLSEVQKRVAALIPKNPAPLPSWCKPNKTLKSPPKLPTIVPVKARPNTRFSPVRKNKIAVPEKFDRVCSDPLLKGLNSGVGLGFDTLKGTPVSKLPIVQWHCSHGKTWVEPINGTVYNVPDEITVFGYPSADFDTSNRISKSIYAFQQSEADWSSFSFGIPGVFGFSDTTATAIARELLKSHNRTLYTAERVFTEFTTSISTDAQLPDLDPRFLEAVSRLPPSRSIPEEAALYELFINTFGDVVATTASYGGKLMYFVAVNEELYAKHTEEWVYHQVQLWVAYEDLGLGIGASSNHSDEKINQDFIMNMENITSIIGGSTNTSYQTFSKTIRANPALVRPTFTEIHHFVQDPVKKKILSEAIYQRRAAAAHNNTSQIDGSSPSNCAFSDDLPVIPGLQDLSLGFDVRTGKSIQPDGTTQLLQVLSMTTYDMQQTYVIRGNPQCYKVPDGLEIQDIPETSYFKLCDSIFTSYDQVLHEQSTRFNVDVGFQKGTFKAGVNISHYDYRMHFEVDAKAMYSGFSKQVFPLFKLQSYPPMLGLSTINEGLSRLFDKLVYPIQTPEDAALYSLIIKKWGTSYVDSGLFGGMAHIMTFTNNSYMKKLDEHDQSTQISFYAMFENPDFGIDGGFNTSEILKHLSQEMRNSSTAENFLIGGIESKNGTQWAASLPFYPGLYNATSTTSLAKAFEPVDAKKAAYLQKVLEAYASQPLGQNLYPGDPGFPPVEI